jgi:hypothetical protein
MKQDIDSILLANWYLVKCKMERPSCNKTELARKYLVAKINKALFERTKLSEVQTKKAFFNFKLN